MKRILYLFCALLLLADFAEDGSFGKAYPVVFRCPETISFTSSLGSSGKVETQVWIQSTDLIGLRQRWQKQRALVGVHNAFALIHSYFFNSSGGIPL
jgi:hypothetical protein